MIARFLAQNVTLKIHWERQWFPLKELALLIIIMQGYDEDRRPKTEDRSKNRSPNSLRTCPTGRQATDSRLPTIFFNQKYFL